MYEELRKNIIDSHVVNHFYLILSLLVAFNLRCIVHAIPSLISLALLARRRRLDQQREEEFYGMGGRTPIDELQFSRLLAPRRTTCFTNLERGGGGGGGGDRWKAGWLVGWHNFSSMGGGSFVQSDLDSSQTVCFRISKRVRHFVYFVNRTVSESSTSEFHLLPLAGCT